MPPDIARIFPRLALADDVVVETGGWAMTVTRTREIPPVTTLLFDLDGTLLDIDLPAFMKAYHSLAGRRFVSPRELPRLTPLLAAATRKVGAYRAGTQTLDRIFLEAFSPAVKRTPIDVRGVLTAFHRAEFEQLRRFTAPRPAARPLLEKALSLGYEIVIATSPVFFLEAIRARIRWAGLEGIPFALITSAEIMRCVKPDRRYFDQTLRLLSRRAEECLMIGDDPAADLPAGLLGIGTWLVIPEPEESLEVAGADCRGTLEELAGWLDSRGTAGSHERLFTLRSMMRGRRIPPRDGVWLWIRIMRTLAERHAAGTVFGRISPDVIFLDGESGVRIESNVSCREEYVAPEIRTGQPPDCRADIYSMGVILFELLTGTLEFAGSKRAAELRTGIPPWLDELTLRCTERRLGSRFQSAGDVSAALLKLAQGVAGSSTGRSDAAHPSRRRHPPR